MGYRVFAALAGLRPTRAHLARALLALLWLVVPGHAQEGSAPRYLGSETCADCHVDETVAWKGSHHAKAWTPAVPENIHGDLSLQGATLSPSPLSQQHSASSSSSSE